MEASLFYTGLVARLYGALRSERYDADPYARFIATSGQPALELGCGDGEPILELRQRGLDVEGVDSSLDMLSRARAAASERGLDVVLYHQAMESMDLPRRYRSVFLAGETFNLLPDDRVAGQALARIRRHLQPGGSALIPLFVPSPTPAHHLGRSRETLDPSGATLRITAVSEDRDEALRAQTTLLRYERIDGDKREQLERPWVLHWHTQDGFAGLARAAGLEVGGILDGDGQPASPAADQFTFWLTVPG